MQTRPKYYTWNKLTADTDLSYYINDGASVKIVLHNTLAGLGVKFNLQLLQTDGTVTQMQQDIDPLSDASAFTVNIPMSEGWIIGANLEVYNGAPVVGQCYAMVYLNTTYGNASFSYKQIMGGYIIQGAPLTLQFGDFPSPYTGPGYIFTQQITSPGAGLDFSLTVPSNVRYKIVSFSATLTTDATAADRRASFLYNQATYANPQIVSHIKQTANQINQYSFANDITTTTGFNIVNQSIPDNIYLSPTDFFASVTENIAAGDTWEPIFITVEQWIDPS